VLCAAPRAPVRTNERSGSSEAVHVSLAADAGPASVCGRAYTSGPVTRRSGP